MHWQEKEEDVRRDPFQRFAQFEKLRAKVNLNKSSGRVEVIALRLYPFYLSVLLDLK